MSLLPLLPEHLEDEALYSFLARTQALNGIRRSADFLESIFGPGKKTLRPELPVGLSPFLERWPEGVPYGTLEALVERTTQYPYHRSFMSPEEWVATLSHAAGGSNDSPARSVGLTSRGVGVTTFLRSCRECDQESWHKFGAVYWHRVHLLPGVTVCWRHREQLTVHARWATGSPPSLIASTFDGSARGPMPRATSWAIQFAKTSAEALYAEEAGKSNKTRSATYLTRLKEFGLMKGGYPLLRELSAQILEHNDGFDGWPIGPRMRETVNGVLPWLRGPLRRPDRVSHPLVHIVLINFLFGSLAAFKAAELDPATSDRRLRSPNPIAEDMFRQYRHRWVIAHRTNRSASTRRRPDRAAYMWLYRHDRDWLQRQFLPHPFVRSADSPRAAWPSSVPSGT